MIYYQSCVQQSREFNLTEYFRFNELQERLDTNQQDSRT